MIRFGREITGDLNAALRREWIVTNGIGGYAMGTPSGARTRRYHSILTASFQPPALRTLLVAALDTWVEIDGQRIPLVTHSWAAGVLLPDGYSHLEAFRLDGSIPTFTWTLGDICIVQRLWMAHGKNTTYITYEYARGTRDVILQVIPLCTYRDHHRETRGGLAVNVALEEHAYERIATISAAEDLSRDPNAELPRSFRVHSNADTAKVTAAWWWSFHLPKETARGLNDSEDLFAAVTFRRELSVGDVMNVICTAEDESPDAWEVALDAERDRETALVQAAQVADAPPWIAQLVLAADQFIVDRAIGETAGKSVIAGYPWFTDWGRDTMIALPGLTLATHRPEVAASILSTFAHFVDQGMLPNRFPDQGQTPEYNTVDATLWYFDAIRAYLAYRDDPALRTNLYPVLTDIIDWYIKGTRYAIHVDPADGLLYAGEAGIQLTWMDVKIGDRVVTPRTGKAVEINALWHNALCIMAELATRLGKADDVTRYQTMAAHAHESFNARFWYTGGYLYDVIDTPDGNNDAALRPNQLIALTLPYRLINDERAKTIVDICARELVTSSGVRSLAPRDSRYIGHYGGDTAARDGAYHQGTAWGWLIGAFVTAHYRVYGDAEQAYSYLEPFADQLNDAGLGTLDEIFEGDPPHTPSGAIAQAWSVAEVLRAYRVIRPDTSDSVKQAKQVTTAK